MPLPFKEHPLRHQTLAELHARVFEPLEAPQRISHIAVVCGERGTGRNVGHLIRLLEHYGLPAPDPSTIDQRYTAVLGDIRLRWERHTEFVSYTFSKSGTFVHPFAYPVINELPRDWLAEMPGEVVTATSMAIESREMPDRTQEELCSLFDCNQVIGAEVVGGSGRAWSDLRIHGDGYSRFLVRDQGLSENQTGRLAKRLLELNAYRAMALLALPIARDANLTMSDADRRLVAVAAQMADAEGAGRSVRDSELLAELTTLAAEIETLAARTTYRFEASRAYYAVVQQRLEQMRQKRIEGLQTFTEFLDARLAPAIATCNSTSRRLEDLAERAARLTSLLRARVEVGLQQQNRSLLQSMDRRAKLQLRLQETVEGLSVIAIGYYGVGLMGYLLKGLESQISGLNATFATGIAAPFVVGAAWWSIRHVKARLFEADQSKE